MSAVDGVFVEVEHRFAAPPELQYVVWDFRAAYAAMRAPCAGVNVSIPSAYPLVPPVLDASSAQVAGILRAGSGSYYRLQQAAGTPGFTLLFSNGAGAALRPTLVPRLNVIRLQ